MRCWLEIMPTTPNNFFECIADQLSHNPKIIAGGTRVTGEEIHHTVHQFVTRNESLLEVSICRFSMWVHVYLMINDRSIMKG